MPKHLEICKFSQEIPSQNRKSADCIVERQTKKPEARTMQLLAMDYIALAKRYAKSFCDRFEFGDIDAIESEMITAMWELVEKSPEAETPLIKKAMWRQAIDFIRASKKYCDFKERYGQAVYGGHDRNGRFDMNPENDEVPERPTKEQLEKLDVLLNKYPHEERQAILDFIDGKKSLNQISSEVGLTVWFLQKRLTEIFEELKVGFPNG